MGSASRWDPMSLTRRSRLLIPLLTLACSVPFLAETAGAAAAASPATVPVGVVAQVADPAAENEVLDRPRHGADADARLGANAAAIAQRNHLPVAKLRQLLKADDTLWLDKLGHGFYVEPTLPAAPTTATALPASAAPFPYGQTFLLHSKSGSNRTIFIDFDGAVINATAWNASFGVAANFSASGFDSDGLPGSFGPTEMDLVQSVWQRVAEDYAPFDVDVTTQDPGLAALDRADASDQVYGVHAIITNSASLWQSVCTSACGGIAYVGVSDMVAPNHEYYQPAIIFQPGLGGTGATAKTIAEGTSHEVGHNFGLNHDGTATLGYYAGQGSWAPIMGLGYNRPIVQWSKGEYAGANNTEDDLAVMATHGATPRADDYGNTIATAATLPTNGIVLNGIISTASDVDFFVVTATGPGSVTVTPASVSPDLDVRLDLYDSAGAFVSSSDPPSATIDVDTASGMDATIAIPGAGTYYVRVDGVGFGLAASTGYSDYASLGQYTIAATINGGPALTVASLSVPSGGVITATWHLASPTATDWIGLYASSGDADTSYLALRYTTGTATGTVPFTIPVGTPAGTTYQLRLFRNNTYTRLATSGTFSVTAAMPPSIFVTQATIPRGGILSISWTGVQGPTPTDWIGIYQNSSAGDGAYLGIVYTLGSSSFGIAEMTVPVNAPAGSTYELRLFSANGYTRLATSSPFTVTAPTPPSLTATPSTIARGGIVTSAWSDIPVPRLYDWVGLYVSSAAGDGAYLTFAYANGSSPASNSLTIPMTAAAGTTYELRYFSNGGYTRLATSSPFTVTAPAAPTLAVGPTTIARGGIITIGWTAIPSPTSTDWVGVYASNAVGDSGYASYTYTHGAAAGSVNYTIPVTTIAGTTYELRLFSNGGFVRLATSTTFTVTAPPFPTLTVSPTPIAAGAAVTVSWTGIPSPSATDWIALYDNTGAFDYQFVKYVYTGGAASGSVPFTIPAASAPGNFYSFRMFSNNGTTMLAGSAYFTVT